MRWNLSDLVLLVEGEAFHVHRAILAVCSSVFSGAFSLNFGEKFARTLPLPGKNAHEIREMLLVIYPNCQKPVTGLNCQFLLGLGREFQMSMLVTKCEDFLLKVMMNDKHSTWDILNVLIVSESYNLMRLRNECIRKTLNLRVEELMSHREFNERVAPQTQREILEGKALAAEREVAALERKVECMADQARQGLRSVNSTAALLAEQIRFARNVNAGDIQFTTEQNFDALRYRSNETSWKCKFLHEACKPFEEIKRNF